MQEYNGLNISRVMYIAQSNLYGLEDEATEQMKIVEGDTKLADLQGFCAGANDVRNLLRTAGFDVVTEREYLSLDNTDAETIIALSEQANEFDSRWNEYDRMKEEMEREKKEFLYSEECTKGRDLAYIHAWKRAVNFITRFYAKLEIEAAAEQQKGLVLPFNS